jgi:hypothetical protein
MVYWEWNYGVIQNGDPNFGESVTMSGQARYGDCVVQDLELSQDAEKLYLCGANPSVNDIYLPDIRDMGGNNSWEDGQPIAAVKDNRRFADPDFALFQHETFQWLLDDTNADSIEGSRSLNVDDPTKGDTSWTIPMDKSGTAVVYAFNTSDLQSARATPSSQPFSYSEGPAKTKGVFNSVIFNNDKIYVAGDQGDGARMNGVVTKLSAALDNAESTLIQASDSQAKLSNVVQRMAIDEQGYLYVGGIANEGDTDFGDVTKSVGSSHKKLFWGKLDRDLKWFSVTQSGSDAPQTASLERALALPIFGRTLLLGYSTRDDVVFTEDVSVGSEVVEANFSLNASLTTTRNSLFSVIADASGKLQRLVRLTLRANFGEDGVANDRSAAITPSALSVIRIGDGSVLSGGSNFTYTVPTGEAVKISVPLNYYLKSGASASDAPVYLDPRGGGGEQWGDFRGRDSNLGDLSLHKHRLQYPEFGHERFHE